MSKDTLTKAMKIVLADSYALYLKFHNYHWNVEGPSFFSLHTFFQLQYEELAIAVDDIAETIRQLGSKAPGSFKMYKELANITDGDENATAEKMVKDLTADMDTIIKTCGVALDAAQEAKDEATTDMMVQRLAVHRKTKWMLKSMM